MRRKTALFLAIIMIAAMLPVNAFASSTNSIENFKSSKFIAYYVKEGECAEDVYYRIVPKETIESGDAITMIFPYSSAKLYDGWSVEDFRDGGKYEFGTIIGKGHTYNELICKYVEGVAEGKTSSQSARDVLYDFWGDLSEGDKLYLPYLITPVSDTEFQVELFPIPTIMCDMKLTFSSGVSGKAAYYIPLMIAQSTGNNDMCVEIEYPSSTTVSAGSIITFAYGYTDDSTYSFTNLSFEPNNGSTVESVKVFHYVPIYVASAPEKEGYVFEGWYTDKNLTEKFVQGLETYKFELTLYANWVAEGSYSEETEEAEDTDGDITVSFETNGGSSIDSVDIAFGGAVVIPINPTKSGYTFGGWYTDSSLTSEYKTTVQLTEDTTLYAKWTSESSSDSGSSSGDSGSSSSDSGSSSSSSGSSSGSSGSSSGSGGGGGGGSSSNAVIKFVSNNGTNASSTYVKKNTVLAEPDEPVYEGYTFTGWYTDSECTELYDFSAKVTSGFTLYAGWKENGEEDNEEETEEDEVQTGETTAERIIKVVIGSTVVSVEAEDGEDTYTIDAAPYIQTESSSTLVPLRFVALAILGGDVDDADTSDIIAWDADTKTAAVYAGDDEITFTAGSNIMTVNGEEIEMANYVKAEITDGRMYIPFRALGEALGVSVDWDAETKTAVFKVQ